MDRIDSSNNSTAPSWQARVSRAGVAVVAVALAVTALAGCAAKQASTEKAASTGGAAVADTFPLTLDDDAGRSVTLKAAARRVVSLAPANTEIVYALGAFDRMVGVTTYDDYPAQVSDVAKVGDFTTPNLEAIAAAKPDLILVTGGVQADAIAKLEGLGAAVLVIDPKDLKGVERSVVTVSRALGMRDKGDAVAAKMRATVDRVRAAVKGREPVSCFVEIGWNPLFTAGEGTLIGDLLTAAGGRNVVTQRDYVGYSVEQLLKDQPAVYLATSSSLPDAAAVSARPGYARLGAVERGRVAVLEDNLVSRPGPRIVQGLEAIARALHPDAF